jgi:hypothetical protein
MSGYLNIQNCYEKQVFIRIKIALIRIGHSAG